MKDEYFDFLIAIDRSPTEAEKLCNIASRLDCYGNPIVTRVEMDFTEIERNVLEYYGAC